MRQDELLRTIRRVLIAHRFEPSRVKTGWHKHNGRGGGGYTDPGFKLEGDHGRIRLYHSPHTEQGRWAFERSERALERYVDALDGVGFALERIEGGGLPRNGVVYHGSVYHVLPQIDRAALDLSCIERRIAELRQDEQQSLQGSLNATTTASHQWWQDQLRHERYLLKLLGAT